MSEPRIDTPDTNSPADRAAGSAPADPAGRRARGGRWVLAGRLALLGAALAAALAAFVLTRGQGGVDRYVCPMHPEVSAAQPGNCPICGMALRPSVGAATRAPPAPAGPAPALTLALPARLAADARAYEVSQIRPRQFSRGVHAPAWLRAPGVLTALLYRDEIDALVAGESGRFTSSATPDAPPASVRFTGDAPKPWDQTTSWVSFHIVADAKSPATEPATDSPGDGPGWLTLPAKSRSLLVVPDHALLQSAEGPWVLVAGPDGRSFTRRRIEIGQTFNGLAVVVGGLTAGERIAVGNTFLLDAASRLGADDEPGRAP